MKKLMMTVAIAAAMVAFGEENCDKSVCPEAAAEQQAEVHEAKPQRPSREELRKRREERMAEMQARLAAAVEERKAEVAKTLAEAGIDEVKAKELAEKIEKIYASGRPARRPRPNRKNREPVKPEEQKD